MSAFTPSDITTHWPAIETHLWRTRSDPGAFERIRAKCADGSAMCLQSGDGVGVVTLERLNATINLVALIALSNGKPGAFARHEADLMQLARDLGAERLAFRTD